MEHRDYTHQLDQGKAGARDVARIMAAFYLSLVEEGVPEEQAGKMAAAYVGATIKGSREA